jgi:hypothetical protein
MTEPATHQAHPSAPVPPPRRGFLLRLIAVATAPAVLLGLAGAWLARSLVTRAGDPLPVGYFLAAFLPTAVLAAALGVLMAYAVDFLLRGQLGLLARTLRTGRGPEARGLASGQGWGGLNELAREVHEAVARADDLAREDAELKALQASADDVLEKVREWAETETPPALVPEGPLAALVDGLRLLADHLEDRAREAREVGELARGSLGEACEGIRRAGREGERSAREIATLLTALGEVRRLSGDLLDGVRAGREQSVAAAQAAAATAASAAAALPAPVEPPSVEEPTEFAERWVKAEAQLRAVAEQLRLVERRALRAALETAAAGLSADRGEVPGEQWWALVAEQKRTMAEASRSREAVAGLERELGEARQRDQAARAAMAMRMEAAWAEVSARQQAVEAARAAAPAAEIRIPEPLPERLVALADRLHQWTRDAIARGERLAALSEGTAAHVDAALAAARTSAEELGGLMARFDLRPAPPAPAREDAAAAVEPAPAVEATESADDAAPEPMRAAWPAGSRPLRLLSREDVLPEEESDER